MGERPPKHAAWACCYCSAPTTDPLDGPTGHVCWGTLVMGDERYVAEWNDTVTVAPEKARR